MVTIMKPETLKDKDWKEKVFEKMSLKESKDMSDFCVCLDLRINKVPDKFLPKGLLMLRNGKRKYKEYESDNDRRRLEILKTRILTLEEEKELGFEDKSIGDMIDNFYCEFRNWLSVIKGRLFLWRVKDGCEMCGNEYGMWRIEDWVKRVPQKYQKLSLCKECFKKVCINKKT